MIYRKATQDCDQYQQQIGLEFQLTRDSDSDDSLWSDPYAAQSNLEETLHQTC